MKLKFKKYIAEEDNGRFNLSKLVMATSIKGERYETLSVIGYGYTFERLLRRMAEDIVSEKDIHTIKEYIDEFKDVIDELKNTLE